MKGECKSLIQSIIDKFSKFLRLDFFRGRVDDFVQQEYNKGLEVAGVQFGMNFVPVDTDVSFLKQYVFDNLQKNVDAVGDELRGELSRGILNKESVSELRQRVKSVFKDDKYSNRLKAVLRTEGQRANNMAAFNGAQQSDLDLLKWVDVVLDGRTSDICRSEHSKYGSKDKAIPLSDEFVVSVKNKTYSALYPPFHPNCRSVVRFVRVKT